MCGKLKSNKSCVYMRDEITGEPGSAANRRRLFWPCKSLSKVLKPQEITSSKHVHINFCENCIKAQVLTI